MRKQIMYLAISVITLFILIQFIRPDYTSSMEKTGDDISRHMEIPAGIRLSLEKSCYDCHSDNTVWPLYSRIAPMSWLIAMDVHNGRNALNLSRWSEYSPMKQSGILRLMCRTTEQKRMPPRKYIMLHPEAQLTTDEKEVLCSWSNSQAALLKSSGR